MKKLSLIAAALAVIFATNAVSLAGTAYILHSFEEDETKPIQFEGSPVPNVDIGIVTGTGNTDGDNAIGFTPAGFQLGDNTGRLAFAIPLSLADVDAIDVENKIKWDITSGPDPNPNDTVSGFGAWFAWNTNLTGFVSSSTFPSTFDTFFLEFISYGDPNTGALGPTTTVELTLDQVVVDALRASITGSVSGSPGFAQFFFGHIFLTDDNVQEYTQPTIYIDYVRTHVPEPSTALMALLGLGGVLASRRR